MISALADLYAGQSPASAPTGPDVIVLIAWRASITAAASGEVHKEKPLRFFSIALLRDLLAADSPDSASKQ
jgi:hypothetical protein